MQRLKTILVCIVLTNNFLFSQSPEEGMCARKFYEYLVKNGLYREAITWLESCQNSSSCFHSGDSLNFELASNYLKTEKYDSAHAYFTRIKVLSDTSYVLTSIYLAILMSDTLALQVYLGKYSLQINDDDKYCIDLTRKIMMRDIEDTVLNMPRNDCNNLTEIADRCRNFRKKSGFKAALLSALIPGLGKRYLGYKHQAWSELFITIPFAAVMAEMIIVSSGVVTVVAGSVLFAVFYSGNIYGTVLLAKKREHDFYNQINEDIRNYYRGKLNCR